MGIFKLNGIDYMGGGGGGDNSMELTYAEYLALPEEEKNNGTTYYVKDINGVGEDQFQPIIYSDEEREVGVWTDGKPLYQRTIRQAFTNRAKITIDTGIDYVQTIETTYYATGVYDSPMFITGATVYCYVQREQDNTITINNEYNGTIEWIVTIQYTKLSDTAGSGTWTPQGVPAVHYSTEEHIVGTWIDGSTLYEKTIVSNDSLPYRTWTTIFSETGANIHRWEGKIYINSTKTQSTHLDYHRGEGTVNESCCTMESNGAIRVTQSIINGTTYGYELTVQYTKS